MKKFLKMMLALSVMALCFSGCNIFGNDDDDDDEKPPTTTTPEAYTLPESIDVMSATSSSTQSSIYPISFSITSDSIEETCDATGKGAYASVTTEVGYSNEVQLGFEIINFLLGVLNNGSYASHLNESSSTTGSAYMLGKNITAKFKVSKDSSSDTMLVKMTFVQNNITYWGLMKVTKSVSTDLPYGEFELHIFTVSSDNWQFGMKVSKNLILYRQNNGDCPNKMRMELNSSTTGKAYFWQDETSQTNGKEKVAYSLFDNSNFFEYRIRTYSNGTTEEKYKAQDRTKQEYLGSEFQLFNSAGALYQTAISSLSKTYDGTAYSMAYELSDSKYYLHRTGDYKEEMRSKFPFKNGTSVANDGTTYYVKTSKFEFDFVNISGYTNDQIKAKVDITMTYNSDFSFESFDVSGWDL